MKKMALKKKLIAGSLSLIILLMITSVVGVSIILREQNRDASYELLEKSLNIIREDLLVKQEKLLFDACQELNTQAIRIGKIVNELASLVDSGNVHGGM